MNCVALTPNVPAVIDHFWEGVATSVKSIDVTASSYQEVTTLVSQIEGYARDLSTVSGILGRGKTVIDMAYATERVLFIAFEDGAMTVRQADALNNFLRTARYVFSNIRIIPVPIP